MNKYQFRMYVSFDIETEFSRDELQDWPEGDEGQLEPNDEVVDRLRDKLTALISAEFKILKPVYAYTDGELMLVEVKQDSESER